MIDSHLTILTCAPVQSQPTPGEMRSSLPIARLGSPTDGSHPDFRIRSLREEVHSRALTSR